MWVGGHLPVPAYAHGGGITFGLSRAAWALPSERCESLYGHLALEASTLSGDANCIPCGVRACGGHGAVLWLIAGRWTEGAC